MADRYSKCSALLYQRIYANLANYQRFQSMSSPSTRDGSGSNKLKNGLFFFLTICMSGKWYISTDLSVHVVFHSVIPFLGIQSKK